MSFDYFYGQQSDLFTFYRVPKVLFTNERFWNISADAKMLYGILLDRMSLSAKNGWIDIQLIALVGLHGDGHGVALGGRLGRNGDGAVFGLIHSNGVAG